MRRLRRAVCAALRAEDGEVLLGIRHYSADMHAQIAARADGDKFKVRGDNDQGFVDQYGEFMSRETAYRVARNARQIIDPEISDKRLYSEMLY